MGAGALTALVGAVMCYVQRHLKRMLAFSTVSHNGLMLLGVALLTPQGLAGTAMYVLAHGLVKGALFMCVGILAAVPRHHGSGRTAWEGPHGTARRRRVRPGGLGLMEIPPFGDVLRAHFDGGIGCHRGTSLGEGAFSGHFRDGRGLRFAGRGPCLHGVGTHE